METTMKVKSAEQTPVLLLHGAMGRPPAAGGSKTHKAPGRPAKTGTFRRLDVEIEENDFSKMQEMKAWLGVRTLVDVVRQSLRVLYVLLKYRAMGKDIEIVDPKNPENRMQLII
jgi:hypothetical protein